MRFVLIYSRRHLISVSWDLQAVSWNRKKVHYFCKAITTLYLPNLTGIMRESHACTSEIVTSRIQTNFSRLTDNSECNCLKTDQISSELFNNARDWLEIPSLEIVAGPVLKNPSENRRKPSENLRRPLKVFRHLRKPSVNLRKFRFCGDEKFHAFYWKKSWQVYNSLFNGAPKTPLCSKKTG